ncbi:fatty-acid-CoA ligase [Mycobacterium tuberculosis]|nr:fatty-acid-CoA ligase [Mycobacterium tuberculosis]
MPNLTDLPGQAVSKLQKSIGQYVARGTAELHYRGRSSNRARSGWSRR